MQLTEAQESLLLHWKRVQEQHGGIPARNDFSMRDLGRHVPNIVVLDIIEDPDDFRYRLIGSTVVDQLHKDYTGQCLSELPGKGPDSILWHNMAAARDTKKPQYLEVPYVGPKKDQAKTAYTLYLPLASDHKKPDKLMLVTHYEPKHYL